MEKYVVTKDLLQKVLNYFSGRPYGEVFQLVQTIQKEATLLAEPAESRPVQETPASN